MTPSIAPELGHLARPGRSPYDDVRLELLDAIIAANGAGALGEQAVWESAFADAVRALRMRVLAESESALRAAAARSRFPARRLRARLPDAEDADILLNRLLAEGMALERFEGAPADDATRRARAAALDAAWEAAVRTAQAEIATWRGVAAEIAAWRPSPVSVWTASAAILVVAIVLALWLGGEVPAPRWFAPVNALWWSLWP